jgi:hypothetical protein
MTDNINSFNDFDEKCSPLPINETRLKEIKAMEEAEQRLIEDLFSVPTNTYANVKAVANVKAPANTKPSNQNKSKKPK